MNLEYERYKNMLIGGQCVEVREHKEVDEKHEDVIAEMRIFKCRNLATNKLENCQVIQGYLSDRLEAAHKREIDAKDSDEAERLSRIYNLVINSNSDNWRDTMNKIEEITREVI